MKFLDNIAIIAPHPDDEILGCGGMIQTLENRICNSYFICKWPFTTFIQNRF